MSTPGAYICFCDDGEPPTVFNMRMVAASRTRHRCTECGRQIQVGESYEWSNGLWEHWSTHHICTHCLALRKWASITAPCFCWTYGNMQAEIEELVQECRRDVPGLYFEYARQIIRAEHETGHKHWRRRRRRKVK